MRYLLDTNILIAGLKGALGVCQKLEVLPSTDLVLSPIVLGELEVGAEKSAHPAKNHARLAALIQGLPVEALDANTSHHYGRIRAELECKGTPIGNNDLWIAAHALALEATVVTDNEREFSRVSGLTVENWLR